MKKVNLNKTLKIIRLCILLLGSIIFLPAIIVMSEDWDDFQGFFWAED